MISTELTSISATRAQDPDAVVRAARSRLRREVNGADGRLLLIAADHPARGAVDVGGVPNAMADRFDLLDRLMTALSRPGVDGVLSTPDIIEDLLLLGALDRKVVIGSMNRGGLHGAVFELDDRLTGYDPSAIAAMGFNGGKMLVRIDLDDAGTVSTLESCASSVAALAKKGLLAMIEPFMSTRVDGKPTNDLRPEAVMRSVVIAQALGPTSRYTWLKLPIADDMQTVLRATTLPVLLLGGDSSSEPDKVYALWKKALGLPGVRGLVVGRSLLYPADGDVASAVDTAARMVHSTPR